MNKMQKIKYIYERHENKRGSIKYLIIQTKCLYQIYIIHFNYEFQCLILLCIIDCLILLCNLISEIIVWRHTCVIHLLVLLYL